MKGVEPSGPRALSSERSAVAAFMKDAKSPVRSDSTIDTAFGFSGGRSFSLASESGQSAPWSIHALTSAICSGRSAPVGGICGPYSVPEIR